MKQIERVNSEKGDLKHPAKMADHRNVMSMRSVAGPSTDDRVIDETPEGEMRIFQKSGFYYSYNWLFGLSNGYLDGTVSRVVTSPDGTKMYIQNPVSYFFDGEENWIVGDIEGDKVSFTFPQLISYSFYDYGDGDVEEYYDYALKLEFIEAEDGDGGWYYPTEDQTYTFNILSDGSLMPAEPEMMIGQCNWFDSEEGEGGYWSWQANGDLLSSMSLLTNETVEVPADVEFESWSLISGIYTRDVKIGIKSDKLYYRGLFSYLPDATVVGVIEGDKVIFDGGQYMGITWDYMATVYFLTGHRELIEDEEGSYYTFVIEDDMTFDYDAENKVLSCPEGTYLLSSVPDRVIYYSYVESPYICFPDPNAEVKALLNPEITSFWDYEDYGDYEYYPEIEFNFPTVDADRQPLDKSKLYYQVIVDGEPCVFYNDDYELPNDEEMITDVPFGYNSYEYGFYASGVLHDVIIYSIGFESLGIRTLYKNGDSVIYSDIVEVDGYSKINDVITDKEKTVVSYYDLTGKKVVRPTAGIYIRQTVYGDGSVKTDKVVRK